jgi:hypothetical protein
VLTTQLFTDVISSESSVKGIMDGQILSVAFLSNMAARRLKFSLDCTSSGNSVYAGTDKASNNSLYLLAQLKHLAQLVQER